MLNGRLISAREVLNNVLRDNDYASIDFKYGDTLEWTTEALDLIGCPYSLIDTISCITIENHRGVLPCNLHTLNQCSGLLPSGVQFPMREKTGTFFPLFLPNANTFGIIDPQEPVGYDADGNPIFNFMNYDDAISKQLVGSIPFTFNDITYNANGNFIYTSFKDGAKVLLAYRAFPVDEDNYPLIPDNIKFKRAVADYIKMKLDYKMWRRNKLERAIFEHSEREWLWSVGAAQTEGLMPTIDKMETIKNSWLHLIPRLNEQSKFFDQLGEQEYLSVGQYMPRY